jgi:ribonuclease HI
MAKKKKNRFYAYRIGDTEGIVTSWTQCAEMVRGRQARYRGFRTRPEAEQWLAAGAVYENKALEKKRNQQDLPATAVYFDAGTGRGVGTEVRVAEKDGTPLTYLAAEGEEITAEGNVVLPHKTNNYGELLACYYAIQVACQLNRKQVLGDSKLVIEYWSRGRVRKETARDPELAALVRKTSTARRKFEAAGGRVGRISGDINPADLGFHR